ncbi:MAG: hypothetical protein KY444_07940 [Gemmatimonadetes bacterium]|nr:hypothetical protein [Gemmatimonadota bacterium]
MLGACAAAPAPVHKVGAFDEIRPQLMVSRAGARLRLARPAHVNILRMDAGRLTQVYPSEPGEPGFLQAGTHVLDAAGLDAWQMGRCSGGERPVSAFRDDERTPGISVPRSTASRGLWGACAPSSAGPGTYAPALKQVLVVASEQPLTDERVKELAEWLSSPAARAAESEGALSARLSAEAGTRTWVAYLAPVRVR